MKYALVMSLLLPGMQAVAQQNFPAKAIGKIPQEIPAATIAAATTAAASAVAGAISGGSSLIAAEASGLAAAGSLAGNSVIRNAVNAAANAAVTAGGPAVAPGTVAAAANAAAAAVVAATPPAHRVLFPRFALYGMGDVNSQSLTQLSTAGKISAFTTPAVCHLTSQHTYLTALYVSMNINAINNDTLIGGTILFPDLGKAGLLSTIETGILYEPAAAVANAGFKYYYGVLGEFSSKKVAINKFEQRDTNIYFSVANLTLGIKGAFYYQNPTNADAPMISVTGLLYYNYVHIPDKDSSDYQFILRQPSGFARSFNSIGFKLTVGINNLQFFADLRHTMYGNIPIPDRRLYSFNSNIGVILPIEIDITDRN